jgi:hypothetical protein
VVTRGRGLFLAATIAAAVVLNSGGTPTDAGARVSLSGDFGDVYSADLAGDGDDLSIAVAGRPRDAGSGDRVVRVYTRGRHAGWSRAPRLPHLLAPGNPISLTQTARGPCVGFESWPRGRVVACLRRGRWQALGSAGLPGSARLLELFPLRRGLAAAVRIRDAVAVLRLRSGARWRRVGKPLPTHGAIPAFGERPGGGAVDVALADVAGGERFVWTLTATGTWERHASLRGIGGGPMPGGPVRVGRRVYLPVNDATREPWTLSVHLLDEETWMQVGPPLSRSTGNAQGGLSAVGGEVWASWQENRPRDDGRFNTRMFVQRIAPAAGSARALWAGVSIGPGSIETVKAAGRRWVLYMPAAKRGAALTVAVEPLG